MFNLERLFAKEGETPNAQSDNEIKASATTTPLVTERLYTEQELERNTHFALMSKLAATKPDWEEFTQFKKATPLERVLNLTPLKSTMAELMLLAVANFETVKDKRFFYQKDKEYYKEQIEQRLPALFKSIQPNRQLFLELLYNLYGYYFIAKHGTKKEQLDSSIEEAKSMLASLPVPETPSPNKRKRNRKKGPKVNV